MSSLIVNFDIDIIERLKNILKSILLEYIGNASTKEALLNKIIDIAYDCYEYIIYPLNNRDLQSLKDFINYDKYIENYIYIFRIEFSEILKDNKIDLNDSPNIINIVSNLIKLANKYNTEKLNKDLKIDSKVIFIFAKYITLCIVLILNNSKNDKEKYINLINSIFNLVELTISPINKNSKLFCFR